MGSIPPDESSSDMLVIVDDPASSAPQSRATNSPASITGSVSDTMNGQYSCLDLLTHIKPWLCMSGWYVFCILIRFCVWLARWAKNNLFHWEITSDLIRSLFIVIHHTFLFPVLVYSYEFFFPLFLYYRVLILLSYRHPQNFLSFSLNLP